MSKPVGILYDNISGNTGDQAIGISVRNMLSEMGVDYEELIPGRFNPEDYRTIVIGGGYLLQPSPNFYYDKFRVIGPHILNCCGIYDSPDSLEYLNDYAYISVRSNGDRRKLANLTRDVNVVPCTAMLLKDLASFDLRIQRPCIGVHLWEGALEEEPFIQFLSSQPFQIYFLPITHYNQDFKYLAKLSQRISNSTLLPIMKPEEIFTVTGKFDYFISASLHGAIFAYTHNVPFILLESQDKQKHFMEDRTLGKYLFRDMAGLKTLFDTIQNHKPDYSTTLDYDFKILEEHKLIIKDILKKQGVSSLATAPLNRENLEATELKCGLQERNFQAHYLQKEVEVVNTRLKILTTDLEKKAAEKSNLEAELQARDNQIIELNNAVQVRDNQIIELNKALQARDSQIIELNNTVQVRDSQIIELNNAVQARDSQIIELNNTVQVKDNQIIELNNAVQARDSRLAELNAIIKSKDAAIQQILSGSVMRLMTRFKLCTDKIMPPGTRRNRYYSLALHAIQVLVNEGWGGLWLKIKAGYFGAKRAAGNPESPSVYQQWIDKNEPDTGELVRQRKLSRKLSIRPRISIIIEYQQPSFPALIASVGKQSYDNWDLYLIIDGKDKNQIQNAVAKATSKRLAEKIIYIHRDSEDWGEAICGITTRETDYLCFMTPGVSLAPFALYAIAKYISDHPHSEFIYSDHDSINPEGSGRADPIFKPDWSPDTLRSFNYIGCFFIVKKTLLEKLNPAEIAPPHDESDMYDLTLRLTENTGAIARIPSILFHKQEVPSTTQETAFDDAHSYRQSFITPWAYADVKAPEIKYRFSLIILNRDKPEFIIPLIDSLKKGPINRKYEVIIGDTGTTDRKVLRYYDSVKKQVKIVSGLKYHFSANYNRLICEQCCGDIAGIMNNDIILKDLSFLNTIETIMAEDTGKVGAIGIKLAYPDGRLQHGGVFFMENAGENTGFPYHRHHGDDTNKLKGIGVQNIPAVTGAFMFFRRSLFIALHGFDEKYEEEAQDIDFCLKCLRAGKHNLFINEGDIVHFENGTRPRGSENPADRSYFLWKWRSFLDAAVINKTINSYQSGTKV